MPAPKDPIRYEEWKKHCSESKKGKKLSEEHKRNLSIVRKGRKISPEWRKRIGMASKQRWKNEEFRDRIRKTMQNTWKNPSYRAKRIGKKHTEEHKRKISDTLKKQFREGNRIPPMLGKHISLEHKEKLIKASIKASRGRIITEETRKKLSESHKGHKMNENQLNALSLGRKYWKGKVGHRYGKELSEEHKRKIGIGNKGKRRSKEQIEKIRKFRLNQILPFRDTSIEILLQEFLKKENIEFIKHPAIEGICQPDLQIKDTKILVFCDGCYWHGCEQCIDKNKFNGFQRAKIVKDNFLTQALVNKGYIVLRFWEHEINKDMTSIINRIKQCMEVKKYVV